MLEDELALCCLVLITFIHNTLHSEPLNLPFQLCNLELPASTEFPDAEALQ